MPLRELLVRVNRIAYREYTGNPGLSEETFRSALGKGIFGEQASDFDGNGLRFATSRSSKNHAVT
jgi:hypothetical protein